MLTATQRFSMAGVLSYRLITISYQRMSDNNQVINSLSINTRLSTCAVSLSATASVDVKLIGVNAVASVSEFTVNLNPLQLNIAKHEVENISLD